MSFIEIKNLKFSYDSSIGPILDIPEFKIEKSEKIFLFGPSGTGKTTLLEILAGILSAQSGTVKIGDSDLSQLTSLQRDQFRADNIAYIFQSFNLIPYLNVYENIVLSLQLRGKNISTQELEHLTAALGIQNILYSPVTEISVGQQQRVAVARALLSRPQIILADEPTSALDYEARENFLKLLFALCDEQKITLIFVSHDRSLQNLFQRKISLPEMIRGQA